MSYHVDVELASNLVWLCVALGVMGGTVWMLRRGHSQLSPVKAIMLASVVCLLLLPAISISDDLLEAHQAALPAQSQTWRMASEGASVWVDFAPVFSAFLFLLALFFTKPLVIEEGDWDMRPHSTWLMRALRLRPPPHPSTL